MTRFSRDYGETMVVEAFQPVAADVNFATNHFPDYTFGANDRMHAKVAPEVPSMKDIVARETAQLIEQQKRLSVRDLTSNFEKGLGAAAKLSEEAKVRNAALLDRHVLLKKLRDVLESLRGRVVGRNKEDIEEALSMVEALAAQLTHKEGELLQEKAEVKRLAVILKQVAEDAKKAAEVERTFARGEIENARAAVRRVEQTFEEQEQKARISEKQDLEQLINEVREARRIKMLHQPSKVVVTQVNGQENPTHLSHVFHVGKTRIKLCKGRITKAKENYSSGMQLCGVRGGGNAAAQALFWQPKKGRSFTIAFESDRERNAAIMLARRFAFDYNIVLGGPNDRVPSSI